MLHSILDWFGFRGQGSDGHSHDHGDAGHGHTHGVVDATIATTEQGIRAIKWSFLILLATAVLQLIVVYLSSSVALLADTIHNMADATTAIPLWIAFALARRKPSARFNYGLGRVEDLAGLAIVLIILASAIVAGYEAIDRLIHPYPVSNLAWLAAAGVIGFLGNEAVAVFRIRVGRRMNSAALIADGYHARTDGLTSLAVVAGAAGVALGFPLADPIIGLLIAITILGIVWQSSVSVITRMLGGVEPGVLEEIRHAAEHVPGVRGVAQARAYWMGHRLHADVTLAVGDRLLLAAARAIGNQFERELHEHLPALEEVVVRFESSGSTAASHHAPDPVAVDGKLAGGLLEIVDTPEGERLRLRVSRHAEGMRASVGISREGGRLETLDLKPVGGDHHWLQSETGPDEPHEFSARLRLAAGTEVEEFPFAMAEPEGHHHVH